VAAIVIYVRSVRHAKRTYLAGDGIIFSSHGQMVKIPGIYIRSARRIPWVREPLVEVLFDSAAPCERLLFFPSIRENGWFGPNLSIIHEIEALQAQCRVK